MTETHQTLNSLNNKRLILVVDDESINRQILGTMLREDYEVIFAEDGEEAMQKIEEKAGRLSLVLLDLIMPKMSGQQVLRRMMESPETRDIPVVVATVDQSQEIECLDAGATDFISKPYPDAGVILARVRRIIEQAEDRRIIESTERDPLTGLYTREFFNSYAEQFDQRYPDTPMDAIVLDINHFSIISERHGRSYADNVLRQVGQRAREMVHDAGGIVCRRDADLFLIYCPHRKDYKAILDNASVGLSGEDSANTRVRLRMGVYSNVDKSLDIDRRFARAKVAADTVRNSVMRNIGVYDDSLRESELYAEQLIEDFPRAIEEKQFRVFYQPKFYIRGSEPILSGAEALVRWEHPELGRISPGVFVPLFEETGLIQELDYFVWHEATRQIRDWKDRFGYCMPVSVNVSRIDMYDPQIHELLSGYLEEFDLEAPDIHLEVTESAYTEDSEQIIETVTRLRSLGFEIEMDDFGTGYSSLNMLATLPIDVLKLDINFIRTAFAQDKDTHMLEVMVEIAEHLRVPIVAEGVETEEQMRVLREVGVDMVQGYFFSEPVKAEDFEVFIEKKLAAEKEPPQRKGSRGDDASDEDSRTGETVIKGELRPESWGNRYSIPLSKASVLFLAVAILAAVALFVVDSMVIRGSLQSNRASDTYIDAQQAANDLEVGSDYLTEQVRDFVVTGEIEYLNNYFEELNVTKRRDQAVEELEHLLGGSDNEAYAHLATALRLSNGLVQYEYRAMRFMLEAGEYDPGLIPEEMEQITLSQEEEALSDEQKQGRAVELVFGDTYREYKTRIKSSARASTKEVIRASEADREKAEHQMAILLRIQTALTIVLLLIVFMIVMFITTWIRKPLARMVRLMKAKEIVPPSGAEELRFVSQTYNEIFEENRKTHEHLAYGNMHDALTGLYNRNAYDVMRQDLDMSRNALMLIDVDKFKTINDTYGHDVGDRVLERVAEVLIYHFRSTDLVFRLGGDEFVVIMNHADSSLKEMVESKIDQINVMLQKPTGDYPPTSLSVGVAFPDRKNPEGDIFKDADTALYRMKEAGRRGVVFY